MTIKGILTAAVAASVLAACGGGGGGGTPPPPPPPVLTPANTSNPAFLPLVAGNVWTFQSNGKITDIGLITLVCSCPINNKQLERLNLTDPAGNFAGALYFAKGAWPNAPYANHRITYLVGVRTPTSGGITLSYQSSDGTIPGYPAMDDTPVTGESLSTGAFSPPDPTTTTISSTGGTQAYGTNQVINSIANATISSGGSSVGFSFAQGVGFTNFNSSAGVNLMVAFAIDAVNSKSVRNVSEHASAGNATSALRSVLDRF